MATEIRVPEMGESVTEGTIANWLKGEGDAVEADEPLVEIETDKVTLEIPAPAAGIITEIRIKDGGTVEVGAVVGLIEEGATASSGATNGAGESAGKGTGNGAGPNGHHAEAAAAPAAKPEQAPEPQAAPARQPSEPRVEPDVPPSVRRIAEEHGLDLSEVRGTGRDGRITKEDALRALGGGAQPEKAPAAEARRDAPRDDDAARENRVPMSRLRRTIATRLKEAQNTAAMLTTFNEVDMSHIMAVRSHYKDMFEKKHGVRLGFMSFFVKACVVALQDIPAVNGEIDGNDLIYKDYFHIGIAVGTEKGLVVPVLRDADQKSLAEIELAVNDFGKRARDGKLKLEELQGGTFSITNGGVYGSLMSTPILNMPQSGILGMHKIEQRPVVVDGEVVVRPMMYLALSYDHRIVDGKEAVTFLVRVKENLEDPQRMLLDL